MQLKFTTLIADPCPLHAWSLVLCPLANMSRVVGCISSSVKRKIVGLQLDQSVFALRGYVHDVIIKKTSIIVHLSLVPQPNVASFGELHLLMLSVLHPGTVEFPNEMTPPAEVLSF